MRAFRFFSLLFALASLSTSAYSQQIVASQRTPGILDLSALEKGGYAELTCLWDFWPNRFVDPREAAIGKAPLEEMSTSHWNQLNIPELKSHGFATYHLRVTGLPRGKLLALKITSPLSAARVFANGEEVLAMGNPSDSSATESPRWDSAIVTVRPDPIGALDLVIHISNHVDFSGGLAKPILLGDYKAIWAVRTSLVTLEMFELGALAIIGFYLILFFAFRPTERHALYFGLLALVLSFRTLCYDEFVLLTFMPHLTFPVLFRMGYLTFSIPFALLAAFFRHLFPLQMKSREYLGFTALSAVFSLFILFAPLQSVALVLFPMEIAAMAFLAYALWMLARAIAARVPGAALVLSGLIMFSVSMVNDILVTNGELKGEYLTPFGIILFFLTLAFMITRNSARAIAGREVVFVKMARDKLSLSAKGLSATEIAYAMALLSGKNVKEIAFEHDVSESTVRNSLARVYGKLGVSSMFSFMSLASRYDISL